MWLFQNDLSFPPLILWCESFQMNSLTLKQTQQTQTQRLTTSAQCVDARNKKTHILSCDVFTLSSLYDRHSVFENIQTVDNQNKRVKVQILKSKKKGEQRQRHAPRISMSDCVMSVTITCLIVAITWFPVRMHRFDNICTRHYSVQICHPEIHVDVFNLSPLSFWLCDNMFEKRFTLDTYSKNGWRRSVVDRVRGGHEGCQIKCDVQEDCMVGWMIRTAAGRTRDQDPVLSASFGFDVLECDRPILTLHHAFCSRCASEEVSTWSLFALIAVQHLRGEVKRQDAKTDRSDEDVGDWRLKRDERKKVDTSGSSWRCYRGTMFSVQSESGIICDERQRNLIHRAAWVSAPLLCPSLSRELTLQRKWDSARFAPQLFRFPRGFSSSCHRQVFSLCVRSNFVIQSSERLRCFDPSCHQCVVASRLRSVVIPFPPWVHWSDFGTFIRTLEVRCLIISQRFGRSEAGLRLTREIVRQPL